MSKIFKVIYAEVRPETVATLEKLCKRYDLPKNKIISLAIALLDENKKPIKLVNK